jgi:hypothetical protein
MVSALRQRLPVTAVLTRGAEVSRRLKGDCVDVDSTPKPAKRRMSRRTALAAAGIGATAVFSSVSYIASAKTPNSGQLEGPVVVRVRDLASGRLEVFTGSTRIEVHDKDLAARLVRAAAHG